MRSSLQWRFFQIEMNCCFRGKLVHGKTWGKKLSSPFFALSFAALFCHFCLIWPTAYIGKQIYSGEYWNTWHTFCGKPSSPLVTKKTRIERMEWMQKNTYNRKFGRSFSKMLMSNVAGKHCTFLKLMLPGNIVLSLNLWWFHIYFHHYCQSRKHHRLANKFDSREYWNTWDNFVLLSKSDLEK